MLIYRCPSCLSQECGWQGDFSELQTFDSDNNDLSEAVSMFQTIRLETKDGGFVRNAQILKFLPGQSPEVVLWGNRVFVQQEMMEVYREVTFYPIIDR